jgi:hypothetical protein
VRLQDYRGDWTLFCNATYAIFRRDFIQSRPRFRGLLVSCRRDPIEDGKEAGYWHCTSEGVDEQSRTPAIRRCERIAWVRAILENEIRDDVDVWQNSRRGERRTLLWFREEYLIVLGLRAGRLGGDGYFQLLTAYDTPEEHRRRKLRLERDAYQNG